MLEARKVEIIGVPLDLGANIRGANIGPSAIRIAGLSEKLSQIGCKVKDSGDIAVPVREALSPEQVGQRFLPVMTEVCKQIAEKVTESRASGMIPICIGGDHTLAIGSIAGASRHCKKQQGSLGLLWIDAHADLNTPESSPTGNLHGMPLAVILDRGHQQLRKIGEEGVKVNPAKVALVGIRTIDDKEKEIVRKSGIRYFTMREIDERGMFAVMKDAITIVTDGTESVHLSFDIDGVDPLYAPGVSTPVTGGLSYREAHLALEMLADTQKLTSMDFVELNPMRDVNHKTAELIVELVQSSLGKSIV